MRTYAAAKVRAHGVAGCAAVLGGDAAAAAAAAPAACEAAAPSASRVALVSAHTWDPCIGDIYSTLYASATLCTAPRAQLLHELGAMLGALRVTHVTATPSLWSLLRSSPRELP